MCLVIDFKARTGVQFGAEQKCENPDWKAQIVRAPFMKRYLESFFDVAITIDKDQCGYCAYLPESIEVANSRWGGQVYRACSSPQITEGHAIAHLYYLVTSKIGREQSVIRQAMPDGQVREFKYDARRREYYQPGQEYSNVKALHDQHTI